MTRYLLLLAICVFVLSPCDLQARSLPGALEYVSPMPNAELVSKETTIIIRPHPGVLSAGQSLRFTVTGSMSGSHTGQVILSDDGNTVIFKPHLMFEPGERVSVTISYDDALGGAAEADLMSFDFAVSPKKARLFDDRGHYPDCLWSESDDTDRAPDFTPDVATRSAVNQGPFPLPPDFPPITINVLDNPDDGHLFVSNFVWRDPNLTRYLMILDNTGFPAYFKSISGNQSAFDFKPQPNGLLTYYQRITSKFLAMDNTYTVVDSFKCGNGYSTDLHELKILKNGHALLMSYDLQTMDMSQVVEGGDTAATVVGLIIQELDTSKNVVFQWRSWDHFEITDAVDTDLTASFVDYAHGNAIEPDFDGNLMISSRSMNEITKIDRSTGDIIWRLNGKNNQFTFVNDYPEGFTRQHDIRRLPNGHITLFDNGNGHDPSHSRALEYELDTVNMTATLVWSFRDDPDVFAPFVGNVQRLPNGNTMVGWSGTNPNAVEVRPDGTKAFEMTFPKGYFTYRAFRFVWKGLAAAPTLWPDTTTVPETLQLGFVKFGDDDVAKYIVYRGDSPDPTTPMTETTENSVIVTDFAAGEMMYFRVTAVDAEGNESPFSNEVAIAPVFSDVVHDATVKVTPRTLNLKSNGRWISARITLSEDCGWTMSDVDLGSILLNDVVSAEHRGSVGKNKKGGPIDFKVKFPRSEVQAILAGGDEVEIKITGAIGTDTFKGLDAIRVIHAVDSDTEDESGDTPGKVALTGNYPNPFNPETTISYTTPASGLVRLNIYDAQGRFVRTLVNESKPGGTFAAVWNGRDTNGASVASGVYFARLQSSGQTQTMKIVLLK